MSLKVALANARSFTELKPIVDKAQVSLSFLGRRYVSVPGLLGTLPIDALASRVIELVNQCHFKFTWGERSSGKIIAPKISNIYDVSEKQVKQSCFFTRVFVVLRNLPSLCVFWRCSLTEWRWDQRMNDNSSYYNIFNYYTRNQYLLKFWLLPADGCKFHHSKYDECEQKVVDCWRPHNDSKGFLSLFVDRVCLLVVLAACGRIVFDIVKSIERFKYVPK